MAVLLEGKLETINLQQYSALLKAVRSGWQYVGKLSS